MPVYSKKLRTANCPVTFGTAIVNENECLTPA